jgi:hypothetical protein
MDFWFIKQPKSGDHVSDTGASSSSEENHWSPAVKKKKREREREREKISDRILTFSFISS